MISTFKNVVTVVDKDLQRKKNLNFSIENGYIKNYWTLESQLDTKLQSVQDQNLIKELVMHWYNRGPGFKPYSGL